MSLISWMTRAMKKERRRSNDFTNETQANVLVFSSFTSQEQYPKFQLNILTESTRIDLKLQHILGQN